MPTHGPAPHNKPHHTQQISAPGAAAWNAAETTAPEHGYYTPQPPSYPPAQQQQQQQGGARRAPAQQVRGCEC